MASTPTSSGAPSGNATAGANASGNESVPGNRSQRIDGWADPSTATIYPGTYIELTPSLLDTCSTGFVFTNTEQTRVYISTASHCTNAYSANSGGGCPTAASEDSIGTLYGIHGASQPGRLAYSSFSTMREMGDLDNPDYCTANDFALVEIDAADWMRVTPATYMHQGPTHLAKSSQVASGQQVISYGYGGGAQIRPQPSGIKYGLFEPSDCTGGGPAQPEGQARFMPPAAPGDSGSFVLDAEGGALGLLVRGCADTTAVNYLDFLIEYANTKGGMDVVLATWPDFVPIGSPP